MQFSRDSWNRMQSILYPDGEVVQYHYNRGGDLDGVEDTKNGIAYPYIDDILYNRFGKRESVSYGNGTKAIYCYDSLQRLEHIASHDAPNKACNNAVKDVSRTAKSQAKSAAAKGIESRVGKYGTDKKWGVIQESKIYGFFSSQ